MYMETAHRTIGVGWWLESENADHTNWTNSPFGKAGLGFSHASWLVYGERREWSVDENVMILHDYSYNHTPRFNEVERGYTGFTLSVCPSARLSVCGQNRVRSVSSTICIGSISYLHILSNNFRRCVVCNVCLKIWKFGEFFKFATLTLSSFDLGSNMTQ